MSAAAEPRTLPAWAERLGLRVPVVCAPMGGVAGGELASAVSRAGALGTIGMGSAGSVAALERELGRLDPGAGPFGIGMVDWGMRLDPAMLERALDARPALVSVSFGDWVGDPSCGDWVEAAHAVGALAVTQVARPEEVAPAEDAGIDLIVARGHEGGGHGEPAHPLAEILDRALERTGLPVLAAGAVATGDDLRSALDRGAAGAWVGTAFTACAESLVNDAARRALVAADGSQTLVTRVLDVALDRPWAEHHPERLIATDFVRRWHGREPQLARDDEAKRLLREALAAADYAVAPLDAGLGVGALTGVEPAERVVERFAGAFAV